MWIVVADGRGGVAKRKTLRAEEVLLLRMVGVFCNIVQRLCRKEAKTRCFGRNPNFRTAEVVLILRIVTAGRYR